MDQFEATLKVARSLLEVPCAVLLFDDGRVISSGVLGSLSHDDLVDNVSKFALLSSSRYLDIQKTSSQNTLFADFPELSSLIVEVFSNDSFRLCLLGDKPCLLDERQLQDNLEILGDLFSTLLAVFNPFLPCSDRSGVVGCGIVDQKRTLQTLKQLHEVTANFDLSLDEKLQRILQVGVDHFSLPIGLISSINDNIYQVEYSCTPNREVLPGMQFELGNTYYVHTLSSDLPTSYHHTAMSDIKEHPCYQGFGLEAYIGVVLYVNGKRWGTLNFSSPNPKSQPFSDDDLEVMKLLAQWVGNEMSLANDKLVQCQYENELREQKQLFQSLFEHAPEAIVFVGGNREIKMLNPAFEALFGYSIEDLIGNTTQILYAEENDFIEQGKAYADNADNADNVLNRHRVSYKTKESKIFHTETIGSRIQNPDGSLGGYLAHIRDVTERLAFERKMLDTNLRLSIAADAAGIGVWELNLKDNTLHWDDWMYRLYGFADGEKAPPEQVWDDCVYPEDKDRLQEVFANLVNGDTYLINQKTNTHVTGELDFDFRIRRQDGQVRYLKSNAAIVFDKAGQASHLIGVNMDITSRKETEGLLRAASDQAVAASKAKSDFLATMSHEIRTPLNGVLGMAELLSGTKLNPEQKSQLGILKESGEGLLGLINDLLDFSKIEAGHLSLERVDFNLEQAIYDIVRLLIIRAEEKGIDLLVEYEEACPRLLVGDVFRIKQVLTNLISNAIKFTHRGHVLISIKGAADQQGMVAIDMSVSDTGVGIADHIQPLLFNAFVQADSSTTRRFGGTGLGLAITKQLIDLMDGTISLSSKLDIGSNFTVTLTLPESHVLPDAKKLLNESVLFGKKALVVDDNETNLAIIKKQLASCYIHADTELSSVQALRLIEESIEHKSPYQVIIIDYMMPELDGLMLAQSIREISDSLYRPVILMTSSDGILTQNVLSAAGVNLCLAKPMSTLVLKKGLITALSVNVIGQPFSYAENWEDEIVSQENSNEQKETKGLILVVEDMKANMAVAQGILNRMGYEVIGAENGQIGIELWDVHKPDLVFMDLHMPVLDGLSAMRRIRQAEKYTNKKRVPIIALTADVMSETLAEVLRAGGDGLVPKPFKPKEMMDMLNEWLSNHNPPEKDNDVNTHKTAFSIQPSGPVVDESVLNELKVLLGEDFALLIEAFFADADSIAAKFEGMLNHEDKASHEAIAKLAHSLKSVSQNVGAMTMSAMAEQLEQEGWQGDIPELGVKLKEILMMYQRVRSVLKDMMLCQ